MERTNIPISPQTAGKVSTDLLQRGAKLDETWRIEVQDGSQWFRRFQGRRLGVNVKDLPGRPVHRPVRSSNKAKTLVNPSDGGAMNHPSTSAIPWCLSLLGNSSSFERFPPLHEVPDGAGPESGSSRDTRL